MWQIKILTLFPELYPGPLDLSVIGNALNKHWKLEAKNIRDYATNKHQSVDEIVYGGGSGMLIRADVLGSAIEDFFIPNGNPIIYLSPRGSVFNKKIAKELINNPQNGINIICGRFEGIDERVLSEYDITEISMGDYVLSSGDIAAFSMIDACVRMLPGVLKQPDALQEESFGDDETYQHLLEYPHYTRPYEWKGHKVPDVLLSGNHKEIKDWRLKEAEEKTKVIRTDLWDQYAKWRKK